MFWKRFFFRFVICTGVTLFAPVLHVLHWCYTWIALLLANQNRVIFFMYIIINGITNGNVIYLMY